MSLEQKSADAENDSTLKMQSQPGDKNGRGEEVEETSSAIAAGIRRDVKPWLNLVDDLSNLTRDAEISIPQICVMGDQSSGKSSVLEALAGVPFPRGSGLVTRCPIRLSMKRSSPGTRWSAVAHASNAPSKSHSVSTPQQLTKLLERLTDSLTKSSNNFSTETINARLSSPDVPDLTVVDLPGIIRTSTAGQDPAVIVQVNSLIESFLQQERTIILCVIPSNQDIATVDILERAQMVDPRGERTIGVLTKPDLIGPGNEDEVLAVLHNVRKPLQLGYVMVKNRSQAQLKAGLSAAEAREAEQSFFRQHPHFKGCDPKLFGVANLTTRLTQLLVTRIQHELVPMKADVESALASVRTELKSLSSYGNASTAGDRQKLLVTVTQINDVPSLRPGASLRRDTFDGRLLQSADISWEYVRHLNSVVQGEYRDRVIVVHPQLRLYTRALGVFDTLKGKVEMTAPRFKDEDFVDQLANQMDALRGRELPGFMSAQSFYMFMAQYVEAWRDPARVAATEVRSLSLEVATKLLDVLVVQYPALREAVRNVAGMVMEDAYEAALEEVDDLLSKEKDPFTINDFLEQHINKLRYDRFEQAVQQSFEAVKPNHESWIGAKEEAGSFLRQWYRTTHGVNSFSNAEDMSAILEAYWLLAAKRFVDNVCMALDKKIMGAMAHKMQEECYKFVHDDAKLGRFFEEDAKLVRRKQELVEKRDRLSKANAAMANIQVRKPNTQQVRVTVTAGPLGLGLSLAEEGSRCMVKGFRPMPDGQPNPGQEAGVRLGDILEQLDGAHLGSFQDAIERLKQRRGTVVLTLLRQKD